MRIFRFDEIDSTSNYLKEKKDIENYDVIIAKNQSAGRGRRGNTWKSEEGAALFTFALKEDKYLPMEEWLKLPLVVGLSVLKALEKIENEDYKFKWTNDVYLNNKKISGILVEKIEGFFIIGIGINVNNCNFGELKEKATSLKKSFNKNYEPEKVAIEVIKEFRFQYLDFLKGNWNKMLIEINQKNYLKDKKINIDLRGKIETGIAKNISTDGRLEVESNGERKKYDIGEIHIAL